MLIQELLRMNVSISRDHYFHEIALKYSYKGSSQVEVHCTYRCLPGTDRCSLCTSPHLKTLKLLRDEYGYFGLYCVFSKRDQK